MYDIPKNSKLEVQCHKNEGGPVTHLIVSKFAGDGRKYFLYEIIETGLKIIASSDNPLKLYNNIWGEI